jgi:hypothetical protein
MGHKLSGHEFYLTVGHCVGIPPKKKFLLLGSLAILGEVSLEIFWNRSLNLYVFVFSFGALTGFLFYHVGTGFQPSCREQQ